MEEKKCIICGAPAVYESMSMASPVCHDCAVKMVKLYKQTQDLDNIEDVIEEVYVPIAGDITAIRNK